MAFGEKKYDPGASATEIKIGNTNPYSGPASSYGVIGKCIDAYWKMVNDRGGINGRKITFISLDDGYSPPKTVEVIRQLVEDNKVLCTFNTLGTPTNTAIHKYMNQKKVPQLYVATGASKWGDPKNFPWTMGIQPDYHTEAAIYAKHILTNVKEARIAVLMQNDDYGKDYFEGLRDGLGKEVGRIVKARDLRDHRSDGRIRRSSNSGLRRQRLLQHRDSQVCRSGDPQSGGPPLEARPISEQCVVVSYLDVEAGGLRQRQGIITGLYLKDPTDHQWDANADMKTWRAFMAKYMPDANTGDGNYVFAYAASDLMEQTLKKCGDDLTRANLMKQAANFHKQQVPLLLRASRSAQARPTSTRFRRSGSHASRETWELFGDVLEHESS